MGTNDSIKPILNRFAILTVLASRLAAHSSDMPTPELQVRFGQVVPLIQYVQLFAGDKRINAETPTALTTEEIGTLRIVFVRDNLETKDGPQFVKITTTSTNKFERVIDDNVQYAITFHRLEDKSADLNSLEIYGGQVNPMGYINPELVENVPIQLDSLVTWGHVFIRVEPEQELVKYYGRIKNKIEYHVVVKGNCIQTGFMLSVPKVIYDTCRDDSMQYGNTSAMLRLYYLNGETGDPYPVNIGIGTFGVDSPIDVSRYGGGFALSLFFDIIQMLKIMDMELAYKVNAGIDISPFFPIDHKPRVLFSARLGISP